MPRYSAFLSYAREDGETVNAVRSKLDGNRVRTWLDTSGIVGGDVWESSIRRALTQSDTVIVFVSSNILGSFVEHEVKLAHDMRKPLIPLVFDDTINADNEFCAILRRHHFIDLRGREDIPLGDIIGAVKHGRHGPVVASYNVKGGVGKTTVAMNLGGTLYKRFGQRVLLVDMDAQTNLSTFLVPPQVVNNRSGFLSQGRTSREQVDLLGAMRASKKSILGVVEEALRIAETPDAEFELARYIHTLQGHDTGPTFDLVVGDTRIKNLGTSARPIDVKRVRNGFARFVGQCRRNYDCVILDLNPAINATLLSALDATTHILSPVKPDQFSLQGLDLLDAIADEQEAHAKGCEHLILINDPKLDPGGIVRSRIAESRYADRLIGADLVHSRYFYANPKQTARAALDRLPAFGNWGDIPRGDRQSLENVSREIADRIGLVTR